MPGQFQDGVLAMELMLGRRQNNMSRRVLFILEQPHATAAVAPSLVKRGSLLGIFTREIAYGKYSTCCCT